MISNAITAFIIMENVVLQAKLGSGFLMTMIWGGSFSTLEIAHVALITLVGIAHKDVGGN